MNTFTVRATNRAILPVLWRTPYTALLIKATLEGLIDEPAQVQGEDALA